MVAKFLSSIIIIPNHKQLARVMHCQVLFIGDGANVETGVLSGLVGLEITEFSG